MAHGDPPRLCPFITQTGILEAARQEGNAGMADAMEENFKRIGVPPVDLANRLQEGLRRQVFYIVACAFLTVGHFSFPWEFLFPLGISAHRGQLDTGSRVTPVLSVGSGVTRDPRPVGFGTQEFPTERGIPNRDEKSSQERGVPTENRNSHKKGKFTMKRRNS